MMGAGRTIEFIVVRDHCCNNWPVFLCFEVQSPTLPDRQLSSTQSLQVCWRFWGSQWRNQEFLLRILFWGDILIRIDDLSAWFVLIVNFTSVIGVIYGMGYLKPYVNSAQKLALHWICLSFFTCRWCGFACFSIRSPFLLAWEVMSLSSMLFRLFSTTTSPKTINPESITWFRCTSVSLSDSWFHLGLFSNRFV